jgi:DNA-binding CsgD family transcriptional regulator
MTGRHSDWGELTTAEMRVLEQAARGLSTDESGRETFHSGQTIKFHRKHILQRLGARNMTHAVALAYQAGILNALETPAGTLDQETP